VEDQADEFHQGIHTYMVGVGAEFWVGFTVVVPGGVQGNISGQGLENNSGWGIQDIISELYLGEV
jgi:hypothetical protein